ncbi:hypothetical protein AMAG_19264 [Allomyces macrogynus ATCC 38327]|uniref:Uncharacterized protein n=1 Tax=Allomyces macrogynus (strain ATCC 38327) TaxID=578462 RepID=A0A0L0SQB3_ALLM3|nr:hypothetical protein AMAG_19264 [Allomyces macrogynus ATCC 38327]|eukprot:KNE64706.1 hypothetical protein AMAG_19264 [Allomyces macrogynus ATCC 38327]
MLSAYHLAPMYDLYFRPYMAPAPTEVPADAPDPWERPPPVQAPDRDWFMAAIWDLRPGELQNVDLKSVGIDQEKPQPTARDGVGRNGPQLAPVSVRPGAAMVVVPSKRASPAPWDKARTSGDYG